MSSTAGNPTENLESLSAEELLSKIEERKEEGRLDKAYEAALCLFHKDNRYILYLSHFVHGHYVEKTSIASQCFFQ